MRPIYIILLLLLTASKVWAETIYIDDNVLVGIHRENSIDSEILKVIPSGTALQVIKQDKSLTQIKSPDGTTGWIDNKYLVKTAPGRAQLQEAQDRITQLEKEITDLKSNTNTGNPESNTDLAKENDDLKQLLKSERLRVGELQAQAAELKNKLGHENNNTETTKKLEQLASEKAELQKQIETLQTTANNQSKNISIDISQFNWKKILITICISLVLGFAAGVYVLDLIIRRRHGGFRI